MYFRKENANPLRRKTSDCVVRAIATGTGKTWDEVYNALCEIGMEMKRMPSTKQVYEAYLVDALGWTKHKRPLKYDGKRYRLWEFVGVYPVTAVVHLTRHVTCVLDGDLSDTWNCGDYCMGNYYTPPTR